MAGASTERCIYSPSSAFSYVHICFSLFLEKQACLSWEHPLCWNHTCSECVVSGSDVFALRPEICGIQEAAYLQSKHCVAEHRLIQQHGCVQYKQDLTPCNNTVQIHTGWQRCCFGHHFKKTNKLQFKISHSSFMWASDSNIQQVAYIAASHIQKLRNSSANSFTSGRPGEDSTSSTLLRKVCVEEKGHHGTVASHGWAFCLCVFVGLHVWDLCEVVGSVMRNGPIGQLLQEAEHWHGPWILGALDLLEGTDD